MKISLFGGAFDPPHLGHQQVAEKMLEHDLVDEVWFVPVFKHPWARSLHKEFLTSYEKRVEMLEFLVKVINEKMGVEKTRIAHYKDISYTYNTLMYFSQKYSEHELSWIMGSEYLSKFDQFLAMHPKLLDFSFFIYPRKGYAFDPIYKNMTALKDMSEIDISSTKVRQSVKNDDSFSHLVLPQVRDYIVKENLYIK